MAKKEEPTDQFFCSFCGKNQKEVKKLIAGPSVYICNECIKLCSEIIEDEEKENVISHSYNNLRENRGRDYSHWCTLLSISAGIK